MKKQLLFITLLLSLTVTVFAQAEKTLIKSVATANASTAVLDLPGEVTVSTWDKDFIRITAIIHITNTTDDILKRLVAVGRYNIISKENGHTLTIQMPKMARKVIIKGNDLAESVSYTVLLPVGMNKKIKKPNYHVANQAM